MTTSYITDIWEGSSGIVLQKDSKSEVDGIHILAKASGPAFFPNTVSKNNVHYSLEAWESAISDPVFRQRLSDRLVFGTIGHATELDDDGIRNDLHSHLITNVYIGDDNIGYADYLVLNTGPGRVLNQLLRIGSKIKCSTRAAGFFEDNKLMKGVKSVNSSSFKLERIDMVLDPGYTDALPKLIESFERTGKLPTIIESTNDSVLLTQENYEKGNTMEKVVTILESRVQELKDEKKITESVATSLQTEIRSISESLIATKALLAGYQDLGTLPSVHESFSELTQYKTLGTIQDLNEALSKSNELANLVESYTAIGSVKEIKEALEEGEETIDALTDELQELQGSVKDSEEDEEKSAEYTTMGSPEDIKDALSQALELTDELQEYRELGTTAEIKQVMDAAEDMVTSQEASQIQNIVDDHDVSRDVVDSLLDKGLSVTEVGDLIAQIKSTTTSEPTEPEVTDEVQSEQDPEVELEDDEKPNESLRIVKSKKSAKIREEDTSLDVIDKDTNNTLFSGSENECKDFVSKNKSTNVKTAPSVVSESNTISSQLLRRTRRSNVSTITESAAPKGRAVSLAQRLFTNRQH